MKTITSGLLGSLKSNKLKLLLVGLLLAPCLFLLGLIVHYGVNTPFWDQWEMVPLFQKVDNHQLGFHDVWQQHNEHRIVFPLVVSLANAYLTRWHTGIEVLIGFCFAVLTAMGMYYLFRRSLHALGTGLVMAFLGSAWFFSPVQWENWTWGWQVEWFMCIAGVVATLYALFRLLDTQDTKKRLLWLSVALVLAIYTTYCLAGGMIVWVVGLGLLLTRWRDKKTVGIWAGVGLVNILIYYHNLAPTPAPNGATQTFFLHHPGEFIEFFLAFIGGVIGAKAGDMQAPVVVGALLVSALPIVLYLVWKRRQHYMRYLPALSLMVYGLLCGLSTAVGRLGYGVGFSLSSRYTAFSHLYIIGLTAIICILIEDTPRLRSEFKRVTLAGLVLISLPLLASSYVVGVHGFSAHSKLVNNIKTCTRDKVPTNDCLSQTYPDPNIVRPRLEYLKSKHWAGY